MRPAVVEGIAKLCSTNSGFFPGSYFSETLVGQPSRNGTIEFAGLVKWKDCWYIKPNVVIGLPQRLEQSRYLRIACWSKLRWQTHFAHHFRILAIRLIIRWRACMRARISRRRLGPTGLRPLWDRMMASESAGTGLFGKNGRWHATHSFVVMVVTTRNGVVTTENLWK